MILPIDTTTKAYTWEMPTFRKLHGDEKYVAQLAHIYREHFAPEWPDKVLHYTSQENFRDIVSSQKFWFNHVSTQIDETEVVRIADLAHQVLSNAIIDNSANFRSVTMLTDLRAGLLSNNQQSTWYTCSFTGKSESLLHWKDYGKKFEGVALVFDTSELLRYLSPSPVDRLLTAPAIYDTEKILHFLCKLVCVALENFETDYGHVADVDEASRDFIKNWGRHAETFSVLPKLDSYNSESEFRFARKWPWITVPPGLIEKDNRKFWPTARGENSDSSHHLLPITAVIVGKLAHVSCEETVLTNLTSAGYKNIQITRSGIGPD
jgi:hypothetical protein